MQWHEFVFSNQPGYRTRRHLSCWLFWWVYLVFTIFATRENPGPNAGLYHHQSGLYELGYLSYSLLIIIKSFLLLLIHLFFCYATVYFLLPNYLSKEKYWHLVTGVLISCTILVPVGYFLYSIVYPFVDKLFGLPTAKPKAIVYASIDAGLVNAIKLTLVMAAITLLKRWWTKQKEIERLEKERINAQLQLLKAQIHPAFLFSTLNNITEQARLASPKAPEMLIKLSDLLSYMLYECDAEKVKLEKEISMLREYMSLEKLRQGERLEMTFQMNGDLNERVISPLILLPFIDNSLFHCNDKRLEQAWINIDIAIDGNNLSMKLINGMPTELPGDKKPDEDSLANVKKRLQLLYPGRHDLKINAEQELLMVHLKLKLEEVPLDGQATVKPTETVLSYAGI